MTESNQHAQYTILISRGHEEKTIILRLIKYEAYLNQVLNCMYILYI